MLQLIDNVTSFSKTESGRAARQALLDSSPATLPEAASAPPTAGDSDDAAQSADVIDGEALLMRLAFAGPARPVLVARVIGIFLNDTPVKLRTISRALAANDMAVVAHALDIIGSSSETLGARRLAELARRAEAQARAGVTDRVRRGLGEMQRQFDLASRQLVAIRNDVLSAPPPELCEPARPTRPGPVDRP